MLLRSGRRRSKAFMRHQEQQCSCSRSLIVWGLTVTAIFLSARLARNYVRVNRTETGYNFSSTSTSFILPGGEWRDTDGKLIQAHGGGVLFHEGTYYWYGENKNGPTFRAKIPLAETEGDSTEDSPKFSCYTSQDLATWRNAGLALKAGQHPDIAPNKVAERPKVLYHGPSRQFVMWLHIDDQEYHKASVGVAVSFQPVGPFKFLRSFRPHDEESRDFTVFKDDDGTAYIAYSSESNKVMHISRLTPDYLDVAQPFIRTMVDLEREAPAIFKHQGWYFMLTSGCTGWAPNALEAFTTREMLGEWRSLGNPCAGASLLEQNFTFFSQANFVLPVAGRGGNYVFMADQWDPSDLRDSRYVWLPLWVEDSKSEKGALNVTVQWYDVWQPQQPQYQSMTTSSPVAGPQRKLLPEERKKLAAD